MNSRFLLLVSILIVAALFSWFFLRIHTIETFPLEEAYQAYQDQDYNKALSLYTKIDSKYHPDFGNGMLDYNIANSYYQLNEYPFAMLYYLRSQAQRPHDKRLQHNLSLTREKLNLAEPKPPSVFRQYLLFDTILSPSQRIQLFFIFAILSFTLLSIYIWIRQEWMLQFSVLSFLITAFFLCNFFYNQYFTEIKAVVIRPSRLQVGETVTVIKRVENQFQVITPDGQIAYLPEEVIRII